MGRGDDRAGVAAAMLYTGLTHGGFYKHFESKDELRRADGWSCSNSANREVTVGDAKTVGAFAGNAAAS
jgi:hypothetical protein